MSAPPPPPKKTGRQYANLENLTPREEEPGQTSEERMANINKARNAFNTWRAANPLPAPPSAAEVMSKFPNITKLLGTATGSFEPTKHKLSNTPVTKNNSFPYRPRKGGKRTTQKKKSLRRKRRVLSRRV